MAVKKARSSVYSSFICSRRNQFRNQVRLLILSRPITPSLSFILYELYFGSVKIHMCGSREKDIGQTRPKMKDSIHSRETREVVKPLLLKLSSLYSLLSNSLSFLSLRCALFVCLFVCFIDFSTSSSATRVYRGRAPRMTSDNVKCCHTRDRAGTP